MKDEIKEKCSNCEYSRQCVTMKQINSECCLKDRENEKKDEIKEILDYLKEFAYKCELEEIYLNKKRIIQLLDYITNLQEENKRLAKEIDMWNGLYNIEFDKARKYKSRNEKAIEYIKERYDYILKSNFLDHDEQVDKRQITYLLNILQGENKDE